MLFDAEVLAPSFERFVSELLPIVQDDYSRDSEEANDAFSEKFLNS